jgi:hypothetical protein
VRPHLQMSNVPALREVLLRGCVQLTQSDLYPLAGLASLESLDLTGCVRLRASGNNDSECQKSGRFQQTSSLFPDALSKTSLAPLNGLPRLRELILNGCTALERAAE